jgi:hypothetical protein
VIHCVAGGEYSADHCAFCLDNLSVGYGLLAGTRLVFVDMGGETRVIGDEIGDSLCMISVPV